MPNVIGGTSKGQQKQEHDNVAAGKITPRHGICRRDTQQPGQDHHCEYNLKGNDQDIMKLNSLQAV